MDNSVSHDPKQPAPISPVVAQIIVDLLAAHPWLVTLVGVHSALLSVNVRFTSRLRLATDPTPPALDDVAVARALLFLANTETPLPSDPTTTAVDAFIAGMAEIMRCGRSVPEETNRAGQAFEYAIARIVHVARMAGSRRRISHANRDGALGNVRR